MAYFPGRAPTYDKWPSVAVRGRAWRGWPDVARQVGTAAAKAEASVVVVECSPDVRLAELVGHLTAALDPQRTVLTPELLKSPQQIDAMVQPWLGDDPVFGRLAPFDIADFMAAEPLAAAREQLRRAAGLTLIVGPGASLVPPTPHPQPHSHSHPESVEGPLGTADPSTSSRIGSTSSRVGASDQPVEGCALFVLADVTRWEAQARQRSGECGNLGADNAGSRASLLYKRSYFVDWRAADRLKRRIWPDVDLVLDTEIAEDPRLASGADVRAGLAAVTRRPFRVVPFFDPAPWGGQWMKEVCDLDRSAGNFGWCFDCVPEENSLILDFAGTEVELPAQDLVYQEPRRLLGDPVHGRFGAEFPIRFDFLDTMGGGNLSLQVHPLTEYIQEQFGMHYTQDESYYLLDAEPGAYVYLGLRTDVEPAEFRAALEAAQVDPGRPLDADRFAGSYPARKHDHFLIPAGTLHCSGAGSMVLEISATPYLFTFKQWDWGRLGLDGRPRPVHIEHGMNVLQWDRREDWVRRNLVDRIDPLATGDGWRKERTGLHEREFIETVRTWFTAAYPATTGGRERGGVHVLNLVEGEDSLVTSPTGAFEPFEVHYAETFVVPAAVGDYRIEPGPRSRQLGQECATITAFVRSAP